MTNRTTDEAPTKPARSDRKVIHAACALHRGPGGRAVMAGKHSKCGAHARKIPAQRRPGIELVDARTRVTHRVTKDELLAGRVAGNYEALCGARLLSASLTEPGRAHCAECAR